MHENQHIGVSRRSLVKRGLCALSGIAIASLAGTKAFAADKKLAKSAVQYEDLAKKEGTQCDDCVQFIPGKTATAMGTRKIV